MAVMQAGPQMHDHLEQLRSENPFRVFIVRGLSKLGFQSEQCLYAHYSQFGNVARVLVPHPLVRSKKDESSRIRPARMGFVVMDSAAGVGRVLAAGADQLVAGAWIKVERFEQMEKPAWVAEQQVAAKKEEPLVVASAAASYAASAASAAVALGSNMQMNELASSLAKLTALVQMQPVADEQLSALTQHTAATVMAEAAVADAAMRLQLAQEELRRLKEAAPQQASSATVPVSGVRPPPGLEALGAGGLTKQLPMAALVRQAVGDEKAHSPAASSFATPSSRSRSTSVGSVKSLGSGFHGSDGASDRTEES